MRKVLSLALTAAALMLTGCASCGNWQRPCIGDRQVVRHVVLFNFKDDVPQEKIDEIETAFAALPEKIDVIKGFEWGTDVSVENLAQGFTHCFFITFADEAGRDEYLPHPAHKEFVALIRPHLEKALVVDYIPGQ